MNEVMDILSMLNIKVRGVLHVGAHRCEEHSKYVQYGIRDVLWIEGNPSLAQEYKNRGFNVINAVISDVEEEVNFNIASNGESSSILDLNKHKDFYPNIHYTNTLKLKTTRLDNILKDRGDHYNMWNLDIQGVELRALKSSGSYLDNVDVIYTEVNVLDLYTSCDKLSDMDTYLNERGFIRLNTLIVKGGWGDALYVRVKQ